MKTHKFRIAHVNNNPLHGSYYKIQQKTFWGWKNVFVSGNILSHKCGFIRYEDAEAHLEWVKKLDEKGVVQIFY